MVIVMAVVVVVVVVAQGNIHEVVVAVVVQMMLNLVVENLRVRLVGGYSLHVELAMSYGKFRNPEVQMKM